MQDENVSNLLRRLSVLYIFKQKNVPFEFLADLVESWFKKDNGDTLQDSSLESLIGMVDKISNDEMKYECIESILQHFFSPTWLSNIECRWQEDINYLAKKIVPRDDIPYQLCLVLLRNACYYSAQTMKTMGNLEPLDLSFPKLMSLCSNLNCEGISNFSQDGVRVNIPRYIPPWLVRSLPSPRTASQPTDGNKILAAFFSNYRDSFSGNFVDIMFDIILAELAEGLNGNETSEQLYLILWREIEIEMTLTRNDQSRLSRVRSHALYNSNDDISFIGSSLSALIVEARLVFYLLKVSYELATGKQVSALSGTYSDLAISVLNQAMSIDETQWQEIFLKNIIRIRGEGYLIELLRSSDVLTNLPWTAKWRNGLPTVRREIESSLTQVEERLRDAINEENRKAREFFLCPHCSQSFAILQRNCGEFVCGRAYTDEIPTNGPLGCGQAFNINRALPYTIDNSVLDPLRKALEKERLKMRQYDNSSQLWERLREVKLPIMISSLNKCDHQNSFIPTSFAVNTVGNNSELMRHLFQCQDDVKFFRMLPGLIEFYIWLNSTFKFLVTHDQATELILDNVLTEDNLKRRFDSICVKHMTALWTCVKEHLDLYLEKNEFHVNWDCERVTIPFVTTKNAPLIMFLSAGSHPTEGYDYLFIIINHIVEKYNYFMLKLNECKRACLNVNVTEKSISPNTVLPGSVGETSLSTLDWINSVDFARLIERYRHPHRDEYDIPDLELAVYQELSSCEFIIESPMKNLRRQFSFRLNCTTPLQDEIQSGYKSSQGFYFVHHQDLQLFEDCQQYLDKLGFQKYSESDINHFFAAKFNGLDYEQLRSVLIGFRAVLERMSDSKISSNFDSLENLLLMLSPMDEIGAQKILEDFGFSVLSETELKTILSMTSYQSVEMIHFVGYQLAAEGYSFANLPVSMKTPLSIETRNTLESNIYNQRKSHNHEEIIKALQEFKVDILNFYQRQIRDHCSSSNQSMRSFLAEQNFCDDSDVIFSSLPQEINVRNYVSLQQELHQLRLALSFSLKVNPCSKEGNDDSSNQENEGLPEPRRGESWLWQSRVGKPDNGDEEDDISLGSSSSFSDSACSSGVEKKTSNLWFQFGTQCIPNDCPNNQDCAYGSYTDDNLSLDDRVEDEFAKVENETNEYDYDSISIVNNNDKTDEEKLPGEKTANPVAVIKNQNRWSEIKSEQITTFSSPFALVNAIFIFFTAIALYAIIFVIE